MTLLRLTYSTNMANVSTLRFEGFLTEYYLWFIYVKITGKFFLKPTSELKLPVTTNEKTLLANETLPQASKSHLVSIVDTCK